MNQELCTIVLLIQPYLLLACKTLTVWYFGWVLACVSFFISDNMKQGRVFFFYQKLLLKWFAVKSILDPVQPFGYKILGGCIICANIWLSMLTFPIIYYFCNFNLIEIPIYLITYSCISNDYLIKRLKNDNY